MTTGPCMQRGPVVWVSLMLHVALQKGQKLRTVDGGGWAGPGRGSASTCGLRSALDRGIQRRSHQVRRERSQLTLSGAEAFTALFVCPSLAPAELGRDQMCKLPLCAVMRVSLRNLKSPLVAPTIDPSVSYWLLASGTKNVEPRTRRLLVRPRVFQTTRAPTPAAYVLTAQVPRRCAPPAWLQVPTMLPVAESIVSPELGTSTLTEGGRYFSIAV